MLSDWLVPRPVDWVEFVNEPQSESEPQAIHRGVNRGCPFGDDDWQKQTVEDLGPEPTLRSRGRPREMVREAAIDP